MRVGGGLWCVVVRLLGWWVDPYGGGHGGQHRALVLEAVGVSGKGRIQRGLASGTLRIGQTVVDRVRGHVADATVTVRTVVPGKKRLTVRPCILNASKAFGELRAVLHRLELGLGERVVIRDMGAAVALGHLQIQQQAGHGLGAHRSSPVGMQRQRSGLHRMACDGIRKRSASGRRHILVGKYGWEVWGCGQAGRFASLSISPCRPPTYPSSRASMSWRKTSFLNSIFAKSSSLSGKS